MEKPHAVNLALVFFLMPAFLSFTVKAQEKQYSTMENSLTIVVNQFEKWKNGTAAFFELLSDDVSWTVSGRSPVSGKYKGKEDFLQHAVKPITEKLKEPLKPELISLTADDKYVWLHFNASAVNKANEMYQNTYIWKLQLENGKIINADAFLDTYELVKLMQTNTVTMTQTIEQTKGYIGIWVTKDGYIRQELLPGNRYDEARGNRQSAYQGEYYVKGNDIFYKDDTGFTADGKFIDENTLHHGGYIFYKQIKNLKK
jgi:ketosteroid isomerase-like protein